MTAAAIVGATVAGAAAAVAAHVRRRRRGAFEWAASWLDDRPSVRGDLAALGGDTATFVSQAAARSAALAVFGVIAAAVLWAVVGPIGCAAPVVGTVVGILWSRRVLVREAARARAELRLAVLELAELVVLLIAGGLGIPAALERAAGALSTSAGPRLTEVLRSGAEPWTALERLGDDVDVAELVDLGRALSVAVRQRARTRESLLEWTRAIRAAQLDEAEAAAGKATEQMTGSLALIAYGFILVVGIPTAVQLLTGASGVHR
jgi:tight adherence protein C